MNLLRNARKSNLPVFQNSAYKFSKSYALSVYKINTIYTFIPKNACSTLRFSIAVANGYLSDLKDVDWIHHNNGTFQASQQEIACAKYSFVILRCPFRRLVSCFFEKFVDGRYKLNDKDGKPLDANFIEFVDFINNQEREQMNEHWRHQVDFLHYQEYFDYFCLEDFPHAINKLKEKGLEVFDTRKVLGHDKSNLSLMGGDFSLTPISELIEMKKKGYAPQEKGFYNLSTYKIIEKKYKEDLEFYKQKFGDKNILKIN